MCEPQKATAEKDCRDAKRFSLHSASVPAGAISCQTKIISQGRRPRLRRFYEQSFSFSGASMGQCTAQELICATKLNLLHQIRHWRSATVVIEDLSKIGSSALLGDAAPVPQSLSLSHPDQANTLALLHEASREATSILDPKDLLRPLAPPTNKYMNSA